MSIFRRITRKKNPASRDTFTIALDHDWAEAQLAAGRGRVEIAEDGVGRLLVRAMTAEEATRERAYRQLVNRQEANRRYYDKKVAARLGLREEV